MLITATGNVGFGCFIGTRSIFDDTVEEVEVLDVVTVVEENDEPPRMSRQRDRGGCCGCGCGGGGIGC
ncbi:hypothetical protein T4A_9970 [Trichinella pseudospiralis]|uniref:Uncharacterized protein n=1 Tax=Trichinella pseudospiralis TaxID=6337 RepID=A0A0V1FRF1_TRIPS|nr:hypothetical protein T4A_9970 [Trichinella pseudospiralis]KRY88600.1 hypothetical protein T4D_12059 [Trichinella pseudospiralis]